MRKTRILMFGWEFPPHHSGGLGVACLGLTRALGEQGYEIIFVMPRAMDVAVPWARFVFAGVEQSYAINSSLTAYATAERYLSERQRGMYANNLVSEVLRYATLGGEIARSELFDVIYAHDWLSFGAGVEAKRVTGKPLVVHVHATEFDRCGGEWGINPDVYAIEKMGMEAADMVIAVSEYTKSIIVSKYGISADKVRVVYNGIDETTAPAGDNTLSRLHTLKTAGSRIVLFLGRITLQKGPDYFIRTAARVLEHEPNTVFIISGSGDMQQQVMQQAATLGIARSVLFTGFLSGHDRYEMYRAADLFIMPSVSEPFGITPLEAMRLGTPVLISKQSGVSEVVKHVLKSDFWDVDNMANQIVALLRNPALGHTIVPHAEKEAARLTWSDAAERVGDVVNNLVDVV